MASARSSVRCVCGLAQDFDPHAEHCAAKRIFMPAAEDGIVDAAFAARHPGIGIPCGANTRDAARFV